MVRGCSAAAVTGGPTLITTRSIRDPAASLMRLAIANYRKAKKLLRAWEAQTLNLIELKGLN